MLVRKMSFVIVAMAALGAAALGCRPLAADESAGPPTVTMTQATSTASSVTTSEPTRGEKKGPDQQSTPPAGQGRGVEATPTSTPAAPPTTTGASNQWMDWKGNGYEFRYPQACQVVQRDQSLTVGARIELAIVDSAGAKLLEYVNQFVDKQTKAGAWRLISRQAESVGGNQAQRIEYQFGGTSRYGTAVFIERNGKIYVWQFTAGALACDEATAFGDIVSSFRFAG